MRRVAIVDYGLCNLDSIARALGECGVRSVLIRSPEKLREASAVIVPGVGAFPDAMEQLRRDGMVEALRECAGQGGTPVLGICLGMQLLAGAGQEVRPTEGLGLIAGEVRRLRPALRERIPHVGWNEVHHDDTCPLLSGILTGTDFYFVHSYHFVCSVPAESAATTPYCGRFTSVVRRGNVFGVQFHPEKSQAAGLRILKNFLAI